MINYYGLLFVGVILIPNIIFAATHKDGFDNIYQNKVVVLLEQIGRFGCFGFEILQIPFLCKGYWLSSGETAYIIIGSILVLLYCLGWIVFWKESSLRKAIILSVLPSLLFLESGILTVNIPLIFLAVIFAFCHITISVKNAKGQQA